MSNENLFDVPNLDDLSTDAEDYKRAADVLKRLSLYCEYKALAIAYRSSGRIDEAQYHEAKMEVLYKRLPDWARW